jgi:hypothetical protein
MKKAKNNQFIILMDVLWNFKYEISPGQAILLTSCAIAQATHFTIQLQYIMMSNLPI